VRESESSHFALQIEKCHVSTKSVMVQFKCIFRIVIPKRGSIARGICCLAGKSRFLADKTGRLADPFGAFDLYSTIQDFGYPVLAFFARAGMDAAWNNSSLTARHWGNILL